MKNFFKKIGASFHSSELYKKAKTTSSLVAVKFILKFAVFAGFVLGVVALILFLIFSSPIKNWSVNFIDQSFPNDLIVTIKDGNLTTNTGEPVLVPFPVRNGQTIDEKLPTNLVVLVPNEKAETSVLEKYDTLGAIAGNGIITKKDVENSEFEIYAYKNLDTIITKDFAVSSSSRALQLIVTLVAIGVVPLFIGVFIFVSLMNMLLLFFVALLVYLMMLFRKIKITYWESYRMSLYTLVPLLIIQIILFSVHIKGIILVLVVVLGIILVASRDWKREIPSIEPDKEILE